MKKRGEMDNRSLDNLQLPLSEKGNADGKILEVRNLRKYFPVMGGIFRRPLSWVRAVDDVSFHLKQGSVLGLVGESGCGKSTLGKTIVGIFRPDDGEVLLEGNRISGIPRRKASDLGKKIQYVYQDPGASLDPWWIIGRTLREPLQVHTCLSGSEIQERIWDMVRAVGLEKDHLMRYPHEFSGGQQRRLGLARVLTLNPSVIIFDEPTSGLDVSVQATILKLFLRLKEELRLSYIFISHDLAVVRMICNEVAVMYLGRIVEMGPTENIFRDPRHPYTKFLLSAIPKLWVGGRRSGLVLGGEPPSPDDIPSGCRFRNRCPLAGEACTQSEPDLLDIGKEHRAACFFSDRVDRMEPLGLERK
jgi:oligopeptide/dipeptide ABC transporter ATP-binding protein